MAIFTLIAAYLAGYLVGKHRGYHLADPLVTEKGLKGTFGPRMRW